METAEMVAFVRARGLGVVATADVDGVPEAALVGLTATDRGELVFDTTRSSRKYRNLQTSPRVAVVVGWEDEVTLQCEGIADTPTGAEGERCRAAYFAQYPDGAERARDPDIVHVRVQVTWLRSCDYRPDSFSVTEQVLDPRRLGGSVGGGR